MRAAFRQKKQVNPKQGQGIYVSFDELTALNAYAKKQVKLAPAKALPQAVNATSKTKGKGLEFDEVRQYLPGDDVRSIDWKVTARRGQAYTKVFQEEKDTSATIIVDCRDHMFFGTQNEFKSVSAAKLSAILAWRLYQSDYALGYMILTSHGVYYQKPAMGLNTLLKMFHEIVKQQPKSVSPCMNLSDAAIKLFFSRKLFGQAVFVISDYQGFETLLPTPVMSQLSKLQTSAYCLYDTIECELPEKGVYPITDGNHVQYIDARSDVNRKLYAEKALVRFNNMRQQFVAHKIQLYRLVTTANWLNTI